VHCTVQTTQGGPGDISSNTSVVWVMLAPSRQIIQQLFLKKRGPHFPFPMAQINNSQSDKQNRQL
jgi:hypothetical protein